MRNKISILVLSLLAVFMFTGCDEEQDPFEGPYQVAITGKAKVVPETTNSYTLGNVINPESYVWTVEGPAEIVGASTGATVSVKFTGPGEVKLRVASGANKGVLSVASAKTKAAVTAKLTDTGVLRAGQSDTVFFNFAAAVDGVPSIALLRANEKTAFNKGQAFVSGTISELKMFKADPKSFFAIYTAGEGNGTPEAILKNIKATAAYGAETIDTAYVQLYRVDNIAPVATITYSSEFVKTGSPITITATFSEPVMFADAADSTLFVTLKGTGIAERDSLEATSNPLVYTYEYTPEITASGTQVTIGLESIVDFAGNQLNGVSGTKTFYVDNTAPVVTGSATDQGNYASIRITSTNSGTVTYVVAAAGTPAPKTTEEFMALRGVTSKTVDVVRNQAKVEAVALAKGDYVIYFMATDKAGNMSGALSPDGPFPSASLSMN